jgi:hypothetical protein
VTLVDPAFAGVDGPISTLFGYDRVAHAVLIRTSAASIPTHATIVGADARLEIDRAFSTPTAFTLVPRYLRAGLHESPVMQLDESVSIMGAMDTILSQSGL